jgi:hypothetical protein
MTKTHKGEKKFRKKHIDHNPQVESVTAVFDDPKARAKEHDPRDFKI